MASAPRASTRPRADTATWVALIGVAVIFAGLMLRGVAASVETTAELIGEFSGGSADQPDIAAAISLGQWGFAMFLVGGALVLVVLAGKLLRSLGAGRGNQESRAATAATDHAEVEELAARKADGR